MPLTLASEQRPSYARAIVPAALVLAAVAAALFYFNPHRTADLSVTHTEIFAPQTTFKPPAGTIHVIGASPEVEQDLYAVVTVHLQDDLRLPLFVDEVDGRYTSTNDAVIDSVSPSAADLARIEQIFPKLRSLMPHPIVLGDTVPPKSSIDGQMLLHFGNIGAGDWQTRKASTLTVHFAHQNPVTVTVR